MVLAVRKLGVIHEIENHEAVNPINFSWLLVIETLNSSNFNFCYMDCKNLESQLLILVIINTNSLRNRKIRIFTIHK